MPISHQVRFNKELSQLAKKQETDLRGFLLTARCSEPTPSQLTLLPKDHKTPMTGRPLVGATDTPGTKLSKMLANVLNPLLDQIPTHLKDTPAFVERITSFKLCTSSPIYFGSFDVSNLYGSIPLTGEHNVYDVAADFFGAHKNSTCLRELQRDDFIKLLRLAIQSDVVFISGVPHKQVTGLPMGNNLSPILAIIFMFRLEENVTADEKILLWCRYIDDIFVIASVPLGEILVNINKLCKEIIFTVELPSQHGTIPFLDTLVEYHASVRGPKVLHEFTTSFYVKALHSGHVLPWQSFVPRTRKITLVKIGKA